MRTWDEEAWIAIGDGVQITDLVDGDGNRVGIMERHVCAGGRDSRGMIPFGSDRALENGSYWTVDQDEPLTISPSIACHACPNHGWIRAGKWVSA